MMQWLADLFGPVGAARNAGAAIDLHRKVLAEVDSAVARLQRHVAAQQPAA